MLRSFQPDNILWVVCVCSAGSKIKTNSFFKKLRGEICKKKKQNMLKFKKDLQFVAFMHLFSVPIRVKKRISYTNQVVTNYGFLHDSRNYYIFKRSVKPLFICTFSGSFSLALISFLFGAHSLIGCHTQLSLCFTLFVYLSLSVFSLWSCSSVHIYCCCPVVSV